jgi:hypothetical protein
MRRPACPELSCAIASAVAKTTMLASAASLLIGSSILRIFEPSVRRGRMQARNQIASNS